MVFRGELKLFNALELIWIHKRNCRMQTILWLMYIHGGLKAIWLHVLKTTSTESQSPLLWCVLYRSSFVCSKINFTSHIIVSSKMSSQLFLAVGLRFNQLPNVDLKSTKQKQWWIKDRINGQGWIFFVFVYEFLWVFGIPYHCSRHFSFKFECGKPCAPE